MRNQSRSVDGCMFCRVRRKKCRPGPRHGVCKDCARFRLQCNGQGEHRPSWLKDPSAIRHVQNRIRDRTRRPDLYLHSLPLSMASLRQRSGDSSNTISSSPLQPVLQTDGLCEAEVSLTCANESSSVASSEIFLIGFVGLLDSPRRAVIHAICTILRPSLGISESCELVKSNDQDEYFFQQGVYCPDEVDTEEITQYHGAGLNDSPDTLGIHPFVDNSPYDELAPWIVC